MTTTLERPSLSLSSAGDGAGINANRAVIRWAWRLFRREWRQQLLVLALITVAVGATLVGSATAKNNPPAANSGFGTASDLATFSGNDPHLTSEITDLEQRFGAVDVIENETFYVPGSIDTYDLRSQNPHGPYGQPMLDLASGKYPMSADQVAITPDLASDLNLRIGDSWKVGGVSRQIVGIVQNPQSLLSDFALVIQGQVTHPTQVSVLFDAHGVSVSSIGSNVTTPAMVAQNNPINPETISLIVLVLGMLLISLVAIGGFTVLAQRRLRSLGMLASIGATDKQVGLVVRANGVVVGVIGSILGTILGLVVWLLYRPHLEQSSHHLIGALALPWTVVVASIVLAIAATYFAASRPARSIARIPIVSALSGRPAPPRMIHRSAVPGVIFLVIGFLLLGYSGGTNNGNGSGGSPELVLGLVCLIPGVILLAPFFLSVLARAGRRTPISVRMALRDLARYRARSGAALAAISLAVMISVIIATVAAARYGNVWDYAGPNMASNQLIVYAGQQGGPASELPAKQLAQMTRTAGSIGQALGAQHVVPLITTGGSLQNNGGGGRQFTGTVYLATPQLLSAFGINQSEINPNADILTMRPGFAGARGAEFTWCDGPQEPFGVKVSPGQTPLGPPNGTTAGCTRQGTVQNPIIQEIGGLPYGVHAPNTVITEHAVQKYGLQSSYVTVGWFIQTSQAITGTQLHNAQASAAAAGMSIESHDSLPTSAEVINWATVFGIAIALCILAMSVGLIRSETASDLRTLSATGASSFVRRTLTSTTAGALGFLGALLGTLAGYVGVIGWIRDNSLNGGIASLGNVPVSNLLVILIGMPIVAAVIGWLLGGRQAGSMTQQPIE